MRDRLLLTLFGAAVGLLGGLAWWFIWGCRACAKNADAWSAFVFTAAVGVVLANAWGMDHLRQRRGR